MGLASAFSVASFSIVLAESFAAIGLSTIIPNATAVAMKSLIHSAPDALEAAGDVLNNVLNYGSQNAATHGSKDTKIGVGDVIKDLAKSIKTDLATNPQPAISLLVPNSATLDASLSFHANESIDVNASAGGMIELVTVKAGFGYLYSEESSNTVKIHVEFVPVEYKI